MHAARAHQGVDLLFYGDSITETWRGTDMGRPCSRCAGVPDVFRKHFASKYESEVLAVGGARRLLSPYSPGPLRMHACRLPPQVSDALACHGPVAAPELGYKDGSSSLHP